jgi:hypothetical protein
MKKKVIVTCKQCEKEFVTAHPSRPAKYCSSRCYGDSKKGMKINEKQRAALAAGREYGATIPKAKGAAHFAWKEDASYGAVHHWMYREHGKADLCENDACPGESERYQWAKKRGALYRKRRENFLKLCQSCHKRYDLGQEIGIKEYA